MTHVMIDLETWGLTAGCAIRSIGARVFDPMTGKKGDLFYRNITRQSCEDRGLKVDPKTAQWWSEQSAEAQASLEDDQVSIWTALAEFAGWWAGVGGVEFWCFGANADEPWLKAGFEACGITAPWSYRDVRCARTIMALANVAPNRDVGVHHNALVDADNQTLGVYDAYVKLGLDGTTFTTAEVVKRLAEKSLCGSDRIAEAGAVLQHECHGASARAGWWNGVDPFAPGVFPTKLCLIHSEISEAMEGDRKSLMDDKLPHRAMAEVELADAAIRIFDLAGARRYDLGGAIVEKMAFNAVREDHKAEVRAAAGGKTY